MNEYVIEYETGEDCHFNRSTIEADNMVAALNLLLCDLQDEERFLSGIITIRESKMSPLEELPYP